MVVDPTATLVAFAGSRRIAVGGVADVAVAALRAVEEGLAFPVLVFDAETSARVDLELRGTEDEVRQRYTNSVFVERPPEPVSAHEHALEALRKTGARPRGRPRLGVISREVTLLPRHWEWLSSRPGGASATLRRLVDLARAESAPDDARRQTTERSYAFMTAMAGDAPGFEEASRALFAGNQERFLLETDAWAPDVREHLLALVAPLWDTAASAASAASPS